MPSPPDQLAQHLGRRLTAHRGDRTQLDVATIAGISDAYLSELEAGKKMPSVRTILRLADALDCQPCDLLVDTLPDDEAAA